MHEIIHSIKSAKEEAMVIKLDMQKAYDRVSWKVLDQILDKFGFT